VSEFKIGKVVKPENIQIGDGNSMVVGRESVNDLAKQVEASSASIQEMQEVIAALQKELAQAKPRPERVRSLVTTLRSAAGAVTAVATSVESVREALGLTK